jgi:hypothetical protein
VKRRMKTSSSRYWLATSAVAAMLAEHGGSQAPIGAPGARDTNLCHNSKSPLT